jgi:D-glycero-D-manno-heptose 1,7-bisphosphate phosphatase
MVGTSSPKAAALFLDRDGTLTRDFGYTYRPSDLAWLPGAQDAIVDAARAGRRVIVVTNQSGIGRGLFTEAEMHAFHAAMQKDLAQRGAQIDAFYFCPFHEDAVITQYRAVSHPDRKPNPGMLLRAIADFGLDSGRCLMVGDAASDLEAARAAQVAGMYADPSGAWAEHVRRWLAADGAAE